MFSDEDLDPKTRRAKPRDLTNMSVSELQEYKADLQAEILRVEADIHKKDSHKQSIDALFKSKDKS